MRSRLKLSKERIGIDILSLSRFKQVIDKYGINRVCTRICSQSEINSVNLLFDKERKISYLANVFTVKEALYKGLSMMGLKRIGWKDVSLKKAENGLPFLKFTHPHPGLRCCSSLTHDAGVVISVVQLKKNR
jgi:phosphopantetheine--protein transferase-like protein